MIALLLTGGMGMRLHPLTLTTPKPMLKVAGMPFMEAQIRLLKACGIKDFVISTGYLADQIEEYFQDGQKWGVNIQFSRETEPLGTGGAMNLAKKYLNSDFLCLNGDDLPIVDYATFLTLGKSKLYNNIMVVHHSNSGGNLRINRLTGKIEEYSKKKQAKFKFVHSGLTYFNKEVLNKLPPDLFDYEDYLFERIAKEGQLYYCESRERTLSIGSFDRLNRTRQRLPKLLNEYSIT